jgi:iron(III) transport system substrate-binding protein
MSLSSVLQEREKQHRVLNGEDAAKEWAVFRGNNEYPANPDVESSELLKSWGDFKAQDIHLNTLGERNVDAVKIFNEVGWK